MFLTPEESEKVGAFCRILQKKPELIGAIVFGSSLLTMNHRDIDIALISDPVPLTVSEKQTWLLQVPDGCDVHFLEDIPIYIMKDAIKGEFLFNRNYEVIFDRFVAIFREWELFRPRFELFLEVVHHGL